MATTISNITMATTVKIEPTKCALRYKPPVLIIFYNDLITGKKRRRSMPLRNFTSKTNVSEYATSLYNHSRHKPYVSSVKRRQLESLLERVRKAQNDHETHHNQIATTTTGDQTLDETILQRQLLPPVTTPTKGTTTPRGKNDLSSLLNIDDDLERILMGSSIPNNDSSSSSEEEPIITSNSTPHKTPTSIAPTNDNIKIPQSRHGSLPPLLPITNSQPGSNLLPPITGSNQLGNSSSNSIPFPSALTDNKLSPITVPKHSPKQDQSTNKIDNEGEYSLSKEPLSELEEEIDELSIDSLSSGGNNDTPLMTSDHLKLIDTTKMISSDDEDDEDYNKMPEGKYNKKKAEMDSQFELRRTKPTDSNFVYDKEEDYGKPIMESGWDSSSESEF